MATNKKHFIIFICDEINNEFLMIIRSIILLLIFVSQLKAISDEFIFKQFTDSDGLSQSTIFETIQDKKGFLWFATIDGLNRYDGYEFRVYNNNPADSFSLSDNFISSLFEDSDGFIWVGTVNGYFNKYDRRTDKFTRYSVDDYLKVKNEPEPAYYDYPLAFSRNQVNTVTAIAEDNEGFLWICTWGDGIIRFNKNTNTAVHLYHDVNFEQGLNSNRITDIILDINGDVWITTFH
ncbi:MAG: two-component regulator propeller domain-containing protein, partial [Nitrososphaeraceae archaeon]|nr:two-component regulator propeller domain-containing protein [Nitrososphaeraceae archaeon]